MHVQTWPLRTFVHRNFIIILLQCVDLRTSHKQWDYICKLKKGISQSLSHKYTHTYTIPQHITVLDK